MSVYKIVFSPTGGTDRAAQAVIDGISGEYITIDLSDPNINFESFCLNKDDFAVAAVPSFGGRVPKTAAERLEKIKAQKTPCAAVCVYGNREFEDTLTELADILENSGFKVAAAVSAIAEHSITPVYASGRPDKDDVKALKEFGKRILEKVKENETYGAEQPPNIPGARPYKKYSEISAVPKAKKDCSECGICADNCPVSAIDKDNIKTADKEKCISCMRCVSICPNDARSLPSIMLKAVTLALKKACSEPKQNKLYL